MIVNDFSISSKKGKKVLLINPPVYDTRYWDKWSQPYGLLRIGNLLKRKGAKVELIDCLQPQKDNIVKKSVKGTIICGDLVMRLYHFGLSIKEIESRLKNLDYKPNEVYITSIMTYWWESTRDVVNCVKKIFPKAEIIIGGIYPTLCAEHAENNINANIIVKGEVKEASDLWTDISLYDKIPDYSVISASRGCPYNCAHCAQLMINGPKVRHRSPEDVFDEINYKYEKFNIKKFAFYEDNILIDSKNNFEKILDLIIKNKIKIYLCAPEGFEIRLLNVPLLIKMKKAGFKSLYLPLEIASRDESSNLDQKNVKLEEFQKVVSYCREAGFQPGIRQELNAFILYGVPNQPVDLVIKAILFAAHLVGNVTPMLFTPVPKSRIYEKYKWYFNDKNLTLEKLNGKLFPFWELNNILPSEYIDMQRLMYAFHTQLRGRAFDLLGNSLISKEVRNSIIDWNKFHFNLNLNKENKHE